MHGRRKAGLRVIAVPARAAREGDELFSAHVRWGGGLGPWWRIRNVITAEDRTVVQVCAGWETSRSPAEAIVVRRLHVG